MTIVIEQLLEKARVGLSQTEPDFDVVEDELDSIQMELIKKGTVAYQDIDWPATFELSVKTLSVGAHIDGLTGAALAIIQEGSDNDIVQLVELLESIIARNWADIHPNSPKFERLKRARLQEIINAIPKRHQKEPIFVDGFQPALGALIQSLRSTDIELDGIEAIYSPTSEGFVAETEGQDGAAVIQSTVTTPAISSSVSGGNPYQADLDAKGRAQLKRDILSLSARIEAFRIDDPTPYYLRAFAATLELRTVPDADETGQTQMNAMPSDIADPIEKTLSAPSMQALQQVEQRLLNSPDWFEGQAFAVQLAEALGQKEVANAIRNRVQNRLERLPDFFELTYTNGKKFLPADVILHLIPDVVGDSQKNNKSDEETVFSSEVKNTFKNKGLADTLDLLEEKSKMARSDRERAVIAILRAEMLMEAGLTELAQDSIKELRQKFSNNGLQEWDSKLYKRVTKILNQRG